MAKKLGIGGEETGTKTDYAGIEKEADKELNNAGRAENRWGEKGFRVEKKDGVVRERNQKKRDHCVG